MRGEALQAGRLPGARPARLGRAHSKPAARSVQQGPDWAQYDGGLGDALPASSPLAATLYPLYASNSSVSCVMFNDEPATSSGLETSVVLAHAKGAPACGVPLSLGCMRWLMRSPAQACWALTLAAASGCSTRLPSGQTPRVGTSKSCGGASYERHALSRAVLQRMPATARPFAPCARRLAARPLRCAAADLVALAGGIYPAELKHAQHFACMSLSAAVLDQLAEALQATDLYIFSPHSLSYALARVYPSAAQLLAGAPSAGGAGLDPTPAALNVTLATAGAHVGVAEVQSAAGS